MVDRYTKAVLTVIALCLVVLTLSTLLPTAQAQSTPQPQSAGQAEANPHKPCVWTAVGEYKMKLGSDGEIQLGKELQALSAGGWKLKTNYQPSSRFGGSSNFTLFVFERCDGE